MINRVVLVGRLTKDIELKKTNTGLSVASFTVACNRRTSSAGQEKQADFINCVAWRQSADFLSQYAKKGALVGVEGRIQTRNYEGTDGKKVYITEVVADSVQLLESRTTSSARGTGDSVADKGYNTSGYEADNSFDDMQSNSSIDISSDDLPF